MNIDAQVNYFHPGENLIILLFEISPKKGTFSEDAIYAYDFKFDFDPKDIKRIPKGISKRFKGNKQKSSRWLSELIDFKSLSYGILPGPCFVVDKQVKQLFFGSCRKPHGPGSDAFVRIDASLRTFWNNRIKEVDGAVKRKRGSLALYLLGDQIYSDDLDVHLSKFTTALGRYLMGYDEELPISKFKNKSAEKLKDYDLLYFYLLNYLNRKKGYDIRNLNFIKHIQFKRSNAKNYRRINIYLFLEAYLKVIPRSTNILSIKRFKGNFGNFSKDFLNGNETLPKYFYKYWNYSWWF